MSAIIIDTDSDGTPIKLCLTCNARTGYGEYAGDRDCPICAGRYEWHLDDADGLDLGPGGCE